MIVDTTSLSDICLGNDKVTQVYKGEQLLYDSIFTNIPQAGVVVCYDNIKDRKVFAKQHRLNKVNFDRFIPIGVVVTPKDAKPLMVSIVLMSCDTPTIGDIEHDRNNTTMHYGPSMTINGIPNTKSKEEALSDFDGEAYTKVLIEKRGNKDYSKWTPGNLTYFDYPAPSCCDMFYTEGTSQTEWYLPACGELNYITTYYNEIESSLLSLVDLGIRATNIADDRYWSSSDYGGLYAWNVVPLTDNVEYNNKQINNYKVRAFYRL